MFAVIIDRRRDPSSPWHPAHVAGLLPTLARAIELGTHVPDDENASVRVVELGVRDFPFFLVEDVDFIGMDRETLEASMTEAARDRVRFSVDTTVHDDVHFIVYRVTGEYAPAPPGMDAMGSLDHFHVVDHTLDELRDGLHPWFWKSWLSRR